MVQINRRALMAAAGVAGVAGAGPALAQAGIKVAGLRTEYRTRPLGLEEARPRLSWRIESARHNTVQAAYRITAAASPDALAAGTLLWDSGKVASDRCFEVPYGGPPLLSGERVWWSVQAWDGAGQASAPSAPSWFEMGLLKASDWKGQWLAVQSDREKADRAAGMKWIWGPNPKIPTSQKFRRTFDLSGPVEVSELLVSGKDHMVGAWVNGEALAIPPDGLPFWGVLTPLKAVFKAGRNVVCIEVKADVEGFFPVDGGAMAALIRIKAAGGWRRIASDAAWKTADGDQPGWTSAGYDDAKWAAAQPATSHVHNEPYPPEPAMLLRRAFAAGRPIAKARLYVTALGAYRALINGKMVTDDYLEPGISVAGDHVFYQSYDITGLLAQGDNALGVVVGDGWFAGSFGWRMERYGFAPGPRRLLAQVELTYADGSRETVATDGQWKVATSPILVSEIYDGETIDHRLEPDGWNRPGFDDHAWAQADIGKRPGCRLVAQTAPSVRPLATLKAKTINEVKPGVFVLDFGQNFSGWCEVKAKGPSGAAITLRFAEVLLASGEVDQSNLRLAKATDVFILRGDAAGEHFEPHFTYHGFRYVQVTGFPGRPTAEDITGVVAHSDCDPSGRLDVANPLVQKVWNNALWAQRSNFFSQPTDCPQRDERMGWMGDIQVFLDAAAFNMDVDGFIRQFLEEVRAQQGPDGAYPIVTPQPLSYPLVVTAGWSEAGVILPWTLYRRYGDTRVIDQNWSAMQRWVAYVADANPDFIWRKKRGLDLGDWLSVDAIKPDTETTPRVLCGTAYWAYVCQLMAEMAQATGRQADAERYAKMREDIARAFAAEFVRPDGMVANGSQTSFVLALRFGLVPQAQRHAAGALLAADIQRRGMKLSTGFLGTPYLLDVLVDAGQTETAIGLLLQTGYPSWGYMVAKGATTMWERWNGDVGDVAMNSYNHYAFGAVVGFMYRRLAGIAAAEPGFKRISVRPLFDAKVGRVKADYDSVLGRISTVVDGDATGLTRLDLTVPANATAVVELPARADGWRQGRKSLKGGAGSGGLTIEVGSGSYSFTAV